MVLFWWADGGHGRWSRPSPLFSFFLFDFGGSAASNSAGSQLLFAVWGVWLAPGSHHHKVLLWPALALPLLTAPFVLTTFVLCTTAVSLLSATSLAQFLHQRFALIERVPVPSAVHAVRSAGMGVDVPIIEVRIFCALRVTAGCGSVVRPYPLFPLCLTVILFHILC